eukprot:TRINITY_DN16424_c0_g2_i2.p3 TRINITY_DN16424_c0_g2~~TRINITY_DN16424_c0_g2_i2.p3  ORF type:complete len:138 (+),score=39.88 TRINITY_DN16424_c0_g2_i2:681-1094(+)
MQQMLNMSHLIFGNAQELRALCEAKGLPCGDVREGAVAVASLLPAPACGESMVVVTDGSSPTVAATRNGAAEFPVPAVPAEAVCDTTGCGDAFAGGFLAAAVADRSVEACVRAGHWAAGEVLRQKGCTLPAGAEPPM